MRIEGVAAVTGAGQGIGLATAAELARRGFEVLALVFEEAMGEAVRSATADASGSVDVRVLDVTDPGDFAFPNDLRVLVNNAGIRRTYLPVEETDPAEWRAIFDVNFFGTVEMCRRAIPALRAAGTGVICNISSAAVLSPGVFIGPYRASKAAVSALSDTLRLEVEQFGVRVVEILPGLTASSMGIGGSAHRITEAADYPAYRAMAELLLADNRKVMPEPTTTAAAAIAIVDAILDDDGPLRYGTDRNSRRLLELWQTRSDEDMAKRRRRTFAGLNPPTDKP